VVVDADALSAIHFWWTDYFSHKAPPLHRSSTRSFSIVELIDGLISLPKHFALAALQGLCSGLHSVATNVSFVL
jgi:hypothetical protein